MGMNAVQRQTTLNSQPQDTRISPVKLNVANLPQGTYYLHIEINGKIEKHQIIIRR
jgi:hypothetical protein